MEVLLHGRADEDVSHIFASLTESELERELQIAARRLRTPSPTTGGTGQHSKACSSGDDQGRLSSPIARCAAALGPQPLSDQDVDAIRKLVSRMATFAAYRACMPGGLEAVENMERWQCKVWTAEAEEHAARMRSQPAAPAKQQQRPRARGQQQQHVSTSKPVRNRTSARNKSGSSAVHQGSSKTTKAVASGRGSGATPAACAHQEHEAQASEPHKDSFSAGHESSCATATDMSLKEGSYRMNVGRSHHSNVAQAPVNAKTVWDYADPGSRYTAQVVDNSADKLSRDEEGSAQEQQHWSTNAALGPQNGSNTSENQQHDTATGSISLQGASGADSGGSRSHKQWILSISSDSGVALGNVAGRSCSLDSSCPPSESLQRAQDAATKEFYSLYRPDVRQHCPVDHPSIVRAVQAHAPSSRLAGNSSSTLNPPAPQQSRSNEVDTSQWNLDSGMPAALYGHSVADTAAVVSDWDRRRSTSTAVPSRCSPTTGHGAPSEELHMHSTHASVDQNEVGQAESTMLSHQSHVRMGGARRRTVNIHTAPAPGSAQQTFGAPRRRFSGADSLYSTQVPKAASELGSDWSHAATPGSGRHSGSSVAYQDIDVSPSAGQDLYSCVSPDLQTKHGQMYAESLACGQHAAKQLPGFMHSGRERLEPREFASTTAVSEPKEASSALGRRVILEQCMSSPEVAAAGDHAGPSGSGKAANSQTAGSLPAAPSPGMHSCLITGSEFQASSRPHSGARPLSRASSSRRLHRGRSLTPSAASESAHPNEKVSNDLGPGDRRHAGLSASNSQQNRQGWCVGGVEGSGKQTDRSRSFDDSIAVYVPYMGGPAAGQAAQGKSAVSGMFQEQNTPSGVTGSAVYRGGSSAGFETDKMPMNIVDSGWKRNEQPVSGELTSLQTSWDVSEPPTLQAHMEQLNLKASSILNLESSPWQHQIANPEPTPPAAPQQARDKFRESTITRLQEEIGQGTSVGETAGPSAGPGALATTVTSGSTRTRRTGATRGGKRHGHLNCRSGRGSGQPAAPLMLATFEGPAQGEMRARLDAVRKLQEETAAAEARSGRGRRVRR